MAKRASARPRGRPQRNGASPAINYALTDRFAGHLVRIVQVRLFQLYYERLGRLGVSPGAFAALTVIQSNPGIAHGALTEALAARGPNVTKLVDKLVRDGLVERRTLPTDRRARGHFLTSAGRAKADAVIKAGLAHDKAVTSSLSSTERASLLQLLAKLDRALSTPSH